MCLRHCGSQGTATRPAVCRLARRHLDECAEHFGQCLEDRGRHAGCCPCRRSFPLNSREARRQRSGVGEPVPPERGALHGEFELVVEMTDGAGVPKCGVVASACSTRGGGARRLSVERRGRPRCERGMARCREAAWAKQTLPSGAAVAPRASLTERPPRRQAGPAHRAQRWSATPREGAKHTGGVRLGRIARVDALPRRAASPPGGRLTS